MRKNLASWIVLLSSVLSLHAQTGTSAPAPVVQSLSLEDCVRMALERNLSIQVGDRVSLGDTADLDVRSGGRIGLEQIRLSLSESYSYYDPGFSASAGQHFNSRPGQIDPTFGTIPSFETWREDFGAGFSGRLPGGGTYELASTLGRLSGPGIPFQYASEAHIKLTQPLLKDFWTDQERTTILLLKKSVKMNELSVRLLVMDVLRKVAVAYYDLVAARDQIRAQQKALELAEQQVAENKKKVQVGNMAPLDERQAESLAATAKADLTKSVLDAQVAENVLKGLISHNFATIHSATLEPTDKLLAVYQAFSTPESWRTGLESRPDYLLAKQQVEAQDITLIYRRNQLYPSLDLEGTYGRNGLGPTTMDSLDSINDHRFPHYGGAVVLKFPLTFRAPRESYKRAKLAKQAALLSLVQVEDNVLKGIDDGVKKVISSYASTEARREARKYAEDALEAEQKKLESGKSTSFQVLQLQRDLTKARSDEIRSLADYNKELHQLYFNEGTILQRMKVQLELK